MTGAASESDKRVPGDGTTLRAALAGRCPRCDGRTVYDWGVQFASRCRSCGLELEKDEPGGRFGVLVTLAVTVPIVLLALTIDEAVRPPLWLHVVVFAPLTVGAVLGALRFAKALFLHLRYHRASRGAEAP